MQLHAKGHSLSLIDMISRQQRKKTYRLDRVQRLLLSSCATRKEAKIYYSQMRKVKRTCGH